MMVFRLLYILLFASIEVMAGDCFEVSFAKVDNFVGEMNGKTINVIGSDTMIVYHSSTFILDSNLIKKMGKIKVCSRSSCEITSACFDDVGSYYSVISRGDEGELFRLNWGCSIGKNANITLGGRDDYKTVLSDSQVHFWKEAFIKMKKKFDDYLLNITQVR